MIFIFNPDIPVRSDVVAEGETTSGHTFFEQKERTLEDIEEENKIRAKRVKYYMKRAAKELPLFDDLVASLMDQQN